MLVAGQSWTPVDTASQLLAEFERIGDALSRRLRLAIEESRTLVEMREALLPELISGKVRVKDAEKCIRRAV